MLLHMSLLTTLTWQAFSLEEWFSKAKCQIPPWETTFFYLIHLRLDYFAFWILDLGQSVHLLISHAGEGSGFLGPIHRHPSRTWRVFLNCSLSIALYCLIAGYFFRGDSLFSWSYAIKGRHKFILYCVWV